MRKTPGLLVLLAVAGCGAPNPLGLDGTGEDGGKGKDVARPVGVYHFAVSASPTDPSVTTGDAVAGPVDLYLWLVSTNLGLSALECDLGREGAELAETYFTEADNVFFLTWEGSGEVVLAVGGCPMEHRLLGTIHLVADGSPLSVSIVPSPPSTGAVDCHPLEARLHPFQCDAFTAE